MGETVTRQDQAATIAGIERKHLGDTHELVVGDLLRSLGALEAPQSDADLMEVLEKILASALTTVHARGGSLLVRDDETEELVFALVQGETPNADLLWRRLPLGKGIANWVAQHATATIVNDTRSDSRFHRGRDDELKFAIHSVLAAPIITGDDVVLGVIEVLNKRSGQLFDENDKTRLNQLCHLVGDILQVMMRQLERTDDDQDS